VVTPLPLYPKGKSRVIKSRTSRWAGYVKCTRDTINTYKILVGNSEEKRSRGRPRRRWEDNIKVDLKET
jgi:hypothetical protein